MGKELLMFLCYGCGQLAGSCPDCVNSVFIDPTTNLPPDVIRVSGKPVRVSPDKEAFTRSVREPICDDCVREANRIDPNKKLETSEERHRRNHI